MAQFPLLSTGAVAQYPTPLTSGQVVEVIRFIDGTDQRYQSQGKILRQWEIQLDLLNDEEIAQLEAFFTEANGAYGLFTFPDPFSGDAVQNCRFATDGMEVVNAGVNLSATSMWVIETYG